MNSADKCSVFAVDVEDLDITNQISRHGHRTI